MRAGAILVLLMFVCSACPFAQRNGDSLYVFVGEKVSVKQQHFKPGTDSSILRFYTTYACKYKILGQIFGNYKAKQIIFYINSHIGLRELPRSKNSLLFVNQINGKLYGIRFMHFAVAKTTDGRQAGCDAPMYADKQFYDTVHIRPVVLNLSSPLIFNINPAWDSVTIKQIYPEPYFKITGDKVACVLGWYAEDIFAIWKDIATKMAR